MEGKIVSMVSGNTSGVKAQTGTRAPINPQAPTNPNPQAPNNPQAPVAGGAAPSNLPEIKQQSQQMSVLFAVIKMAIVFVFCGLVAVIASALNSREISDIFEIFNL